MSVENLEKALSRNIPEDEVKSLAMVLDSTSKMGEISYQELKGKVEDPNGLLLLAEEKRLLLPRRTSRSRSWEDRILLFEPEEYYEMPRIIRHLVRNAKQTGKWDLKDVSTKLFREMGEEASEQIPELIESLEKKAEDYGINASQIKETWLY